MPRSTHPDTNSRRGRIPACVLPTEADLVLYRDLARQLGAPPNAHICRHAGPAAHHLVFINESGPRDWTRVHDTAAARWPDLPKSGSVARDGTVLDSLPERIVYEMLAPRLKPRMALDLHQPIRARDARHRADFTLRCGAARRFIEVVGCCGSDRITRNDDERLWLARLDRRLAVYAAQGIVPVLIHLDLLAQPARLRTLCDDLVRTVAREGGCS
ncbi:hypothetical protein FHR90_000695 [Endobacter medicaginis]|uniref:DUF559 domain-containing protein n=3 Tax=Endobacter medicaginis TaxID=1181271 RepID=A0A839V025_9PROT|nr:hypothetical protein [Endobacter medicaginis]MBB3172881.1 hypothetical protein [Endobacter medicaginis]MCX5474806.1 hypothetical protein [Endobacter medicaginis]